MDQLHDLLHLARGSVHLPGRGLLASNMTCGAATPGGFAWRCRRDCGGSGRHVWYYRVRDEGEVFLFAEVVKHGCLHLFVREGEHVLPTSAQLALNASESHWLLLRW